MRSYKPRVIAQFAGTEPVPLSPGESRAGGVGSWWQTRACIQDGEMCPRSKSNQVDESGSGPERVMRVRNKLMIAG